MAQGRAGLIVVPREHGAWAMLVVPYIVGAGIAGQLTGELIAGLAGILLLFFGRASLALLLKHRSVDGTFGPDSVSWWLNFGFFTTAGTLVFLYLMVATGLRRLGLVAVAGIGLFIVHEWLVWRRRERSVAAELVGVALLTLTAPLAVYISGCDSCDRLAATLWLLNAMYFGASVFYVKMKLRTSARSRRPASLRDRMNSARGSITYMTAGMMLLASMVALDAIPPATALAFIPMFIYQSWGIIHGAGSMTLKAEGVAQTVLSAAFALLMIAAFRM